MAGINKNNQDFYLPGDDLTEPPPRNRVPHGDTDTSIKDQHANTVELAQRVQRITAKQTALHLSDRNAKPPALQRDPVTQKLFYDSAPTRLKRLLGSPLAQIGRWATGFNKERQLSDGWGSPRPASNSDRQTSHKGLDFIAPLGEAILASADGIVEFVGYQPLKGDSAIKVIKPKADINANILDSNGNMLASVDNVGYGGIFVRLSHDGDFQGYQTEYFHMHEVIVSAGKKVNEGQTIGFVGHTGRQHIGPHLHYQVKSGGVLVNPTGVVPNKWPGHTDSSNSDSARGIALPALAAAGLQIANTQIANTINTFDTGNTMLNQSLAVIRDGMAAFNLRTRDVLDVKLTQLFSADAAFKEGKSIVVKSPMTFNFETGVWSDGKVT